MISRRIFWLLWYAVDGLLLCSVLLLAYALAWELSTRQYLEGFSDAVVPLSGSPEEKVEAILAWMRSGPARRNTVSPEGVSRDPYDTLNQSELLRVCGSATNAFLNLADSGGLEARRVLLLDERELTKHVVAEVRVDGRWVVADPSFRRMLRDAHGRPLGKEELRDPEVLRTATAGIPAYNPSYTYERTAHIRLAAIPLVGSALRQGLDRFTPGWEEAVNWSLLVERRSLSALLLAAVFLGTMILLRLALGWYGEKRLQVTRLRLRDHVARVYGALFGGSD